MTDCPHHPQVCSSREVDELLAEIQKAQSLRDHMQALHPNAPCEKSTSVMQEVGAESQSSDLPGGTQLASPCSLASHLSLRAWLPGPQKWSKARPRPLAAPTALNCHSLCWKDPGGFSNWKKKMYFRERPSGLCHPFHLNSVPPFPPIWRMMKTSATQGRRSGDIFSPASHSFGAKALLEGI